MSFHESTSKGDVILSLKTGIVYGALWAIGSSWSVAIREVVLLLVPENSDNQVLAELGAALLTTTFGVATALLANLDCKSLCDPKNASRSPAPTTTARTRK